MCRVWHSQTVLCDRQIHIVDGETLRVNPVLSLSRVQKFLGVEPLIDYSQLLRSVSSVLFSSTKKTIQLKILAIKLMD